MEGIKDEELTVRWIQFGVFSPIMRLHSVKSRWVTKEPWKFDHFTGGIISEFLRLRHRLIPYLHTMNARAAIDGEPLIQPMYWECPFRQEAYRVKNQYLFGSEMIVMPITAPQDPKLQLAKVKGWLPPGRFVDFFTGAVYEGNRELWIRRPLDQYPIFLKEGSIVPLDDSLEPENGGGNPEGFEVVIAVGADGSFEMLEEDENESQGKPAQEIEWIKTGIDFTQETGTVKIQTGAVNRNGGARRWTIRLLGIFDTAQLKPVIRSGTGKLGDVNVLNVSKVKNGCVINLGKLQDGATTIIELGLRNPRYDWASNWSLSIESIIDNARIDYALKDAIWELIAAKKTGMPTSLVLNGLRTLDMSENLMIALSEHLVDGFN